MKTLSPQAKELRIVRLELASLEKDFDRRNELIEHLRGEVLRLTKESWELAAQNQKLQGALQGISTIVIKGKIHRIAEETLSNNT